MEISFPTIGCNGYTFTPKGAISEKFYSISSPLEAHECLISVLKNNSFEELQQVCLNASQFQIDTDLKIMHRAEEHYAWALVGALVSVVVSACFVGIKRNWLGGAAGIVLAGVCAYKAYASNKLCKKASFDAANKAITVMQKSNSLVFSPADYGLS